MASEKLDVPSPVVNTIAEGYVKQIRDMPQQDVFFEIIRELPFVAKEYGVRDSIEQHILTECARLIMRRFSHLGVVEIRQAFRELNSGSFVAKGAEPYGGVMSAALLGKTLTAYSEFRKGILGPMLAAREADLRQIKEREVINKRKERFERQFPIDLEKFAKAKDEEGHYLNGWQQVPAWWYDAAMKRDMLNLTKGMKRQAWEEAQELSSTDEDTQRGLSIDTIVKKEKQKAVVLAQKMLVFRHLILPIREHNTSTT